MTAPTSIATNVALRPAPKGGTLPQNVGMRTFLQLLFGGRNGHREISTIEGDPDSRPRTNENPNGFVFHQQWKMAGPDLIDNLIAHIQRKDAEYGDVYISVNGYKRPNRAADVLPGRVVFADDAPEDVDCTFIVRSGTGRPQAYWLLDHEATSDVLHDLARRATYTVGTDKSGHDLQQLARIPGTHNTKAKHGGNYLVTMEMRNGRRYSVAELRERWPEAQIVTAGDVGDLDWPEVEHWLGNLDQLLNADKLPKRIKKGQTYEFLSGKRTIFNRSDVRCIVAKGLAMHGYPDDEIAALLWHFCDYGHSTEKGTDWLKADITRIVTTPDPSGKGNHVPDVRKQCNITPSASGVIVRKAQPTQPIVHIKPLRKGRKIVLTPQQLLTFYQNEAGCSDVILLTRPEVAKRLKVSVPTVQRVEKTLTEQGAIERRHFNRRQSSLVELCKKTSDQNAQTALQSMVDHVRSDKQALPHQSAECAKPQPIEGTLPRDRAPLRPQLRVVMRQAFDACAQRLDEATGELLKQRVTRKRVYAWIDEHHGALWNEVTLAIAYAKEREGYQYRKLVEGLPHMALAILRAQLRHMERLTDKSRREESNMWRFTEWAAREIRAEMARRPAEPTKQRRRTVVEALPDLRMLGAQRQQEIEEECLDLASRHSAGRQVQGERPRGSVPPQPPLEVLTAPVDEPIRLCDSGVGARLYKLKAQREAQQSGVTA